MTSSCSSRAVAVIPALDQTQVAHHARVELKRDGIERHRSRPGIFIQKLAINRIDRKSRSD